MPRRFRSSHNHPTAIEYLPCVHRSEGSREALETPRYPPIDAAVLAAAEPTNRAALLEVLLLPPAVSDGKPAVAEVVADVIRTDGSGMVVSAAVLAMRDWS